MLLSVGDIVGRGIRCTRRGWRLLLEMFLLASVLYSVGITATTWAATRSIAMTRNYDASTITFTLVLGAVAIISVLGATFLFATRTVAVKRMALMEGMSARSALEYARSHKWKAVLLYAINGVSGMVVIAAAAGVIFGFWIAKLNALMFIALSLLVFIWTCIAQIFLYQFWVIALSVLAVEETAWRALFARSLELTKSASWRGVGYVFLVSATMWAIGTVLNAPLVLFFLMDFLLKTKTMTSQDVPLWLRVFDTFWIALKMLIMIPCAVICNALFYNDLRLRMDGWDLVKRVELLSQMDKPLGETKAKSSDLDF